LEKRSSVEKHRRPSPRALKSENDGRQTAENLNPFVAKKLPGWRENLPDCWRFKERRTVLNGSARDLRKDGHLIALHLLASCFLLRYK
jgi:hypothetical protein